MSPLAPSDSVDAFLTWLAAPANVPPSTVTSSGHAPLSDSEYAARLRELARSPLEDMAKPLLGPVLNVNSSPGVLPENKTPMPQHAKRGNGRGDGNGNGSEKKKREAESGTRRA